MIASYPIGGVAWDYGQYALALERLGWEVYYLEDTGWETYDPVKREYGSDPVYGARFLEESLSDLSSTLGERWHFRAMDGATYGMERARFLEVVADADLLLNVSNSALLRDEYMRCACKAMIDTDPGWNHFVNFPKWDASPGWQGTNGYRAHDHFFTYAECIGKPDCILPTFGIDWHATRPPVILDRWRSRAPARKWTTVMTWNNFREPVTFDGQSFGTKEVEFPKLEELPARVGVQAEVAASGNGLPTDRWRALGWSVVDSHSVSQTLADYRSYIECSRGELSVAKNLYVGTRSGWFSCRTVCYLAAGKPVVVQDTGFSDFLPTGAGLLTFSDSTGAAEAVCRVEEDYERHCRAAREVAGDCFEAGAVLSQMLRRMGLA